MRVVARDARGALYVVTLWFARGLMCRLYVPLCGSRLVSVFCCVGAAGVQLGWFQFGIFLSRCWFSVWVLVIEGLLRVRCGSCVCHSATVCAWALSVVGVDGPAVMRALNDPLWICSTVAQLVVWPQGGFVGLM